MQPVADVPPAPEAEPDPDGEPFQPRWRRAALLGVPLLLVVAFVAGTAWDVVSGHYGARVANDRAAAVEAVARQQALTANDVELGIVLSDDPELAAKLDRLEVPGTELVTQRSADGAGDAYVVLRSTAWGGTKCVVLAVGSDGDISSRARDCRR